MIDGNHVVFTDTHGVLTDVYGFLTDIRGSFAESRGGLVDNHGNNTVNTYNTFSSRCEDGSRNRVGERVEPQDSGQKKSFSADVCHFIYLFQQDGMLFEEDKLPHQTIDPYYTNKVLFGP